jgi:RecB family endonuclease NucS
MVAELDGSVLIRDKLFGPKDKPENWGSSGEKILHRVETRSSTILRRIRSNQNQKE